MTEIKLTEEDLHFLINVLDQISIQGTETMKKVLVLSEKLKKATKKSVSKGTDAKSKG